MRLPRWVPIALSILFVQLGELASLGFSQDRSPLSLQRFQEGAWSVAYTTKEFGGPDGSETRVVISMHGDVGSVLMAAGVRAEPSKSPASMVYAVNEDYGFVLIKQKLDAKAWLVKEADADQKLLGELQAQMKRRFANWFEVAYAVRGLADGKQLVRDHKETLQTVDRDGREAFQLTVTLPSPGAPKITSKCLIDKATGVVVEDEHRNENVVWGDARKFDWSQDPPLLRAVVRTVATVGGKQLSKTQLEVDQWSFGEEVDISNKLSSYGLNDSIARPLR